MTVLNLPTAVFAIIIEDDRLVEIRPTSLEELVAWLDRGQRAEARAGADRGPAEGIVGVEPLG